MMINQLKFQRTKLFCQRCCSWQLQIQLPAAAFFHLFSPPSPYSLRQKSRKIRDFLHLRFFTVCYSSPQHRPSTHVGQVDTSPDPRSGPTAPRTSVAAPRTSSTNHHQETGPRTSVTTNQHPATAPRTNVAPDRETASWSGSRPKISPILGRQPDQEALLVTSPLRQHTSASTVVRGPTRNGTARIVLPYSDVVLGPIAQSCD